MCSFRDEAQPCTKEHREHHAEFQQLVLQVRIRISLLPRHCTLGQVHVIGDCPHRSVDCQDVREMQDLREKPWVML